MQTELCCNNVIDVQSFYVSANKTFILWNKVQKWQKKK